MIFTYRKIKERGFALLLSIIIASVVLSIGISILNTSVNQLSLSSTSRESELAFQSAQTMMDCLRYWRYERAEEYRADPGNSTDFTPPVVECVGVYPFEYLGEVLVYNEDSGYIVTDSYTYEWGTPLRCTSAQMSIMSPDIDSDLVYTFPGTSVGDNGDGEKICEAGTTCTVLISQGYNRPCGELQSSIFTVQRELTLEL